MINKLIIMTTAICRINIHEQTFNSYIKILDDLNKKIEIKWFINLDKPDYCEDDYELTKKNLLLILKEYDIKILSLEKPNFLNAVKNLVKNVKNEINDSTCILWLEDDWIAQNNINLDEVIEKFVLPYSYISLVYNKLGSFPPFIMGPKLSKIFINGYIIYNVINNPETISRKILRKYVNTKGIEHYSYFNDNNINELNNNNLCNEISYSESYLTISDNYVLVELENDKKKINENYYNIKTIEEYKNNINSEKIILLHFGYNKLHLKYKHSFFKDIGREWKKNLKNKL